MALMMALMMTLMMTPNASQVVGACLLMTPNAPQVVGACLLMTPNASQVVGAGRAEPQARPHRRGALHQAGLRDADLVHDHARARLPADHDLLHALQGPAHRRDRLHLAALHGAHPDRLARP
eukprot:1156368-Prymnesium_polylepis.2